MDYRDHEVIENTQCDEALLRIVEAIVFVGISGAFKDYLGVGKLEAVLLDISLCFASLHVNRISLLYIHNAYASRLRASGLTNKLTVRVERRVRPWRVQQGEQPR